MFVASSSLPILTEKEHQKDHQKEQPEQQEQQEQQEQPLEEDISLRLLVVGVRFTRPYEKAYVAEVTECAAHVNKNIHQRRRRNTCQSSSTHCTHNRTQEEEEMPVQIKPVTDDVDSYFQQADCLLLASTNEVTPLVILEAMARGLPAYLPGWVVLARCLRTVTKDSILALTAYLPSSAKKATLPRKEDKIGGKGGGGGGCGYCTGLALLDFTIAATSAPSYLIAPLMKLTLTVAKAVVAAIPAMGKVLQGSL